MCSVWCWSHAPFSLSVYGIANQRFILGTLLYIFNPKIKLLYGNIWVNRKGSPHPYYFCPMILFNLPKIERVWEIIRGVWITLLWSYRVVFCPKLSLLSCYCSWFYLLYILYPKVKLLYRNMWVKRKG